LRHAGHDVLVLHVMDPDELEFPFTRMTMFEGLEGMQDQLADPEAVREAYLAEVREFTRTIRRDFRNSGIQYQLADCSRSFDQVLREALVRRSGSPR
jgi:spore germination protein YaaH